jgi:hypothetical protein
MTMTLDSCDRRLVATLLCALAATSCSGEVTSDTDGGGKVWSDLRTGEVSIRPDGQSCAEISQKAELPPLDMLLLLDTSGSMDYLLKWPSVKGALKTFVGDPKFASLGVGIQYFPLRAQCNAAGYATPAVSIGPLSGGAAAIAVSLDTQRMAGGTPMVPVLSGALTYAGARAAQYPDRKVVIVLATDGIPDNTCLVPSGTVPANTLPNVVSLAGDGAKAKPSIPTFVIGVGKELTALNQISQAGGTGDAFLVDTSKDIQQAFLQALNDIRRTLACEYKIPPPPGGEVGIDFEAVNIRYTVGDKTETFVFVGKKEGCDSAPDRGWYYDEPTKPTLIILCPQTCKRAQSDDNGRIDVVVGCKTIPS